MTTTTVRREGFNICHYHTCQQQQSQRHRRATIKGKGITTRRRDRKCQAIHNSSSSNCDNDIHDNQYDRSRRHSISLLSSLASLSLFSTTATAGEDETLKPSAYDFTVQLNGQDVSLSKYRGKVSLIMNIASE